MLDAGAEWSFRFVYLSVDEQFTMERRELTDSGWTVVVPESFAKKLQSAGTHPPDAPVFPEAGQTSGLTTPAAPG